MDRLMRALLLLALASGCGTSNSAEPHDMAAPGDLAMAADQSTADLAMADLATTAATGADMVVPPDMAPIVVPHWSADGPVNAVAHAGTAWYLGGSFNRLSPYPMPQLIAIDTAGTPTGCPVNAG